MVASKMLVSAMALYGAWCAAAHLWKLVRRLSGDSDGASFAGQLAAFAVVCIAATLLVLEAVILGVWQ